MLQTLCYGILSPGFIGFICFIDTLECLRYFKQTVGCIRATV